jgi:hypothetical protein
VGFKRTDPPFSKGGFQEEEHDAMSETSEMRAANTAHDPVAATKIARIESDLANLASSVKQLVDDTRMYREHLAREREEDRKASTEALRSLGETLSKDIADLGSRVYRGTDWGVILTGAGLVMTLFAGFAVYTGERFTTIIATIERDRQVSQANDTDLATTAVRIDDAFRAAILKINDESAAMDKEHDATFADLYAILRERSQQIGELIITGERNYEDIKEVKAELKARTP